jgi:hypothetical protein
MVLHAGLLGRESSVSILYGALQQNNDALPEKRDLIGGKCMANNSLPHIFCAA